MANRGVNHFQSCLMPESHQIGGIQVDVGLRAQLWAAVLLCAPH
jgi:hypothetical protein